MIPLHIREFHMAKYNQQTIYHDVEKHRKLMHLKGHVDRHRNKHKGNKGLQSPSQECNRQLFFLLRTTATMTLSSNTIPNFTLTRSSPNQNHHVNNLRVTKRRRDDL